MARSADLPEPLRKGLRDIASLSESEFDKFLSALQDIPVEIRQHRVFPDFDLPGFPENGESIKSAAFSLILGLQQRQFPVSEIIDSVIDALKSYNLENHQMNILRHRIEEILKIESLALIARAHRVLLEHSSTYSSVRIISDIRSIFGDDVTAQPQAAVIVHMLNITYNSAGRRENIALALDEKDIDELISVLERARSKTKTLRSTIEKSGIRYIKVL